MSNNLKHGGQAFPAAGAFGFTPGMSLRDYFAAKAMQGDCARAEWESCLEDHASWAYLVADAMLKAREA